MSKNNISEVYSHDFMKIKISSDGDLPLQKTLSMHNVVILVKSVFNKNHNYDYQTSI